MTLSVYFAKPQFFITYKKNEKREEEKVSDDMISLDRDMSITGRGHGHAWMPSNDLVSRSPSPPRLGRGAFSVPD